MPSNYYQISIRKTAAAKEPDAERLAIELAKCKVRISRLHQHVRWSAKHIGQTPIKHHFRVRREICSA